MPTVAVRPLRQAILGRDAQGRMVVSEPDDSIGIVGPPRYGKTTGVIIPTLLCWDGPAVCTSTRGDVLRFVGRRRRELAAPGGAVHVYDPFHSEFGRRSIRWSPLAGCADASLCYRRVAAMTAVAGRHIEDGDHWRAGAAQLLRAYFHAAALEGLPLADVRHWIAGQAVRDPAAIIAMHPGAAHIWAEDLEAIALLGDRERGSFYQVARSTLEAASDPTVLASCAASDIDLDEFLATRSSLFVIGPSHYQQAIAPLVAGLVDAVSQRAAEVAASQGGRLEEPLLLALDEVANIAPLQNLPALVSEGGGRGIVTMWAVQSLAQLRARYGDHLQEAILAATSAKLIYGGLSNDRDLANVSSWAGDVQESTYALTQASGSGTWADGRSPGPVGFASHQVQNGPAQRTVGASYRPALPIAKLQQLRPLSAFLFWRSSPPQVVETPPAGTIRELVAMAGLDD